MICLYLYLHKCHSLQASVSVANFTQTFVDMCGVKGKRRLCDLNVTSSSPALATRRYTLSAVGQ